MTVGSSQLRFDRECSAARLAYAMAIDGLFPCVCEFHPNYGTPCNSHCPEQRRLSGIGNLRDDIVCCLQPRVLVSATCFSLIVLRATATNSRQPHPP